MFSLRKEKTVTQPIPALAAPDVVTSQRLDNLERRLRALEDHYTELEHSIAEKEQSFKEALEAYKSEVNSVIKTFTERVGCWRRFPPRPGWLPLPFWETGSHWE